MALPTMRKDGSEPPSPKHNASVWILVLAAICGSITLLVLLGMPVAAAVVAVPTLAVVANQVVGHLNGSPSEEKPPAPPQLPDAKNHAAGQAGDDGTLAGERAYGGTAGKGEYGGAA